MAVVRKCRIDEPLPNRNPILISISLFSHFFPVINSTYQPNEDANGSVEQDILYQSDASFGAKLDNSKSHNSTVTNKTNSNSSPNTNKNTKKKTNNSENSNHIRLRNSVNKSSVKHRVNNSGSDGVGSAISNRKLENSESSRSNGDKTVANNIDDNDHKTNVNPIDLDSDSNLYVDDDDDVVKDNSDAGNANGDDDDINYDGDKISASESIVIKLGSKSANVMTKKTNTKPKSSGPTPPTAAPTSTVSSIMNSFNDDYYSKDDMSVYDDVNNNRLNLRNANGHVNAYEQRNIYVANELSDGAANANDSAKSYIHIEVYKGNLDDLTTLRTTTVAATTAASTTTTTTTASPTTTPPKPDATSEP